MAASPEERKFQDRIRRVESLIHEVDQCADPALRAKTKEIVQILMDMHGTGLERILNRISEVGEPGMELIDSLAADELVESLLLLYGLHPLDLQARVEQALIKVRPYLASHGGNVELLGIEDGHVRLRLEGSCHGCPSSAVTLKQTIEEAILEKAPDVAGIDVVGEESVAVMHAGVQERTRSGFALPVVS
jgi:Fe-S cluster biogenesis protein NfuA